MHAASTSSSAFEGGDAVPEIGTARDYWFLAVAGLGSAWLVKDAAPYAPGSVIGYYLGLAGGVAMLAMLLYPLIKRIRVLPAWLPLKYWFRAHLFLGVLGPLLVVFHSKLQITSINGTAAFGCMTAVFLSGLVGRFIYTQIHHGLCGQRATQDDLTQRLAMRAQEVNWCFQFAPEVETRLRSFQNRALAPVDGICRVCRFLFMPAWTLDVYGSAVHAFYQAIHPEAQRRGWDKKRLRAARRHGRRMLWANANAVRAVAQFPVYERLFRLWRVAHVSLVFLLFITSVMHVVAVHPG